MKTWTLAEERKARIIHELSTPISIVDVLSSTLKNKVDFNSDIIFLSLHDLSVELLNILDRMKTQLIRSKNILLPFIEKHEIIPDTPLFYFIGTINTAFSVIGKIKISLKMKESLTDCLTGDDLHDFFSLFNELKSLTEQSKKFLRDLACETSKNTGKHTIINSRLSKLSLNQRLKILVVEDEEIFQMLARDCLSEHDVDVAMNGDEAIKFAKRGRYDLILMDLSLPSCSGQKATEEIRSVMDTPIIALTSRPLSEREENTLLNSGFDYCLRKPLLAGSLSAAPFSMVI